MGEIRVIFPATFLFLSIFFTEHVKNKTKVVENEIESVSEEERPEMKHGFLCESNDKWNLTSENVANTF